MQYLIFLVFVFAPLVKDWKIFKGSDFLIQYQDDWELDKSGAAGTKFILFAPNTHQPTPFRDNINLIVEDLKGQDIDIAKYAKLSIAQVKQYITKARILRSETIEKKQMHKIMYTGEQGDLSLQFQQYYWVKNGTAYVLTFTATQASFGNHEEVVNRTMDSFTIN